MAIKTINGKALARVAAVVGKAIDRVKTWLGIEVAREYGANLLDGSHTYTTDETLQSGTVANLYDGNTATDIRWGSGVADAEKWLRIEMAAPVAAQKFRFNIKSPSASYDVTAKWQGSNDGTSFTDLVTHALISLTGGGAATWYEVEDQSQSTVYAYYRLHMTLSLADGRQIAITELEMFALG